MYFDSSLMADDGFGGFGSTFGGFGGGGFSDFGSFSSQNYLSTGGGGLWGTPGGTQSPGGGISITIPSGGSGGSPSGPSLNQTLTQIVNSHELALQTNLAEWQVQRISATDAISTGWRLMDSMVTACRRYGSAGDKSAAERDRRINPAALRWDWIAYYIDPITGGNTVAPPPPGGGTSPVSGGTGSPVVTPGGTVLPGGGFQTAGFPTDLVFVGVGVVLLLLALRR